MPSGRKLVRKLSPSSVHEHAAISSIKGSQFYVTQTYKTLEDDKGVILWHTYPRDTNVA